MSFYNKAAAHLRGKYANHGKAKSGKRATAGISMVNQVSFAAAVVPVPELKLV